MGCSKCRDHRYTRINATLFALKECSVPLYNGNNPGVFFNSFSIAAPWLNRETFQGLKREFTRKLSPPSIFHRLGAIQGYSLGFRVKASVHWQRHLESLSSKRLNASTLITVS